MTEILTVQEAATRLKVSQATLRLYARTGIVRGTKLGKFWRFSSRDVDDLLKEPEPPKPYTPSQEALDKEQLWLYGGRRVRRATPAWADKRAIQNIYVAAQRKCTDRRKYSVDHIIPLIHEQVCGLHVAGNLRIVTVRANSRKCNRWKAPRWKYG